MNYFLHIDTSAGPATVAIGLNGKLVCSTTGKSDKDQAGTINLMIQAMLHTAGISFRELSAIVVCAGPGSYTGLRVGMATAKGLCYALNIPLILHNKLTLIAYQAFVNYKNKYDLFLAILLARDKEFFISEFDCNFANTIPAHHIDEKYLEVILQKSKQICIISQCFIKEKYEEYRNEIYVHPFIDIDVAMWVYYAFEHFDCNNIVNLSTSEPFYLKQVYTHN